jgi:hypothetical protein
MSYADRQAADRKPRRKVRSFPNYPDALIGGIASRIRIARRPARPNFGCQPILRRYSNRVYNAAR